MPRWMRQAYRAQTSPLVYCIFQGFASAELGHLGSLDLDALAGTGVTPGARSALTNVESTESDQGDTVVLLQGLFDGRNSRIKRLAGDGFGNFGLGRDLVNQFGFIHVCPLNGFECNTVKTRKP